MTYYPEHDKLLVIKDKSQAIGEFMEWCADEGLHLAEWWESHSYTGCMQITLRGTTGLVAEFYDIDLNVLEAEKRAMLNEQRRLNEQTTQ